ncbi:MAG: AMP-dependent synthetase [Cycloclasticus sp. symbiont of Bathymodiolus heckerae]|nr:MAG: AMP-dependent synthetase [Cycloclasticus sp. symbiont of Bathymodiolus heckerae]
MNEFPKTLIEALDNNQDASKCITYISGKDSERTVSYPDLKQRALGLLHHIQQKGATEGDELIIHLGENEQFIDTFWACQYGGIVAVPLAIGTSDGHRQKVFNVFEKLKAPYIATSRKALQRLKVYAEEQGKESIYNEIQKKALMLDRIEEFETLGLSAKIDPEQTAFIQFSSGSTGDPKGVVLTHKNLVTNLYGIIECSAFDERDSFFGWMPLTHDMGIIGFHLTPLFVNIDQYIMPTELFVRRPNLWLEKVSEKETTIIASPNFGYKHVLKRFKPENQDDLNLSRVRLIFNGAEPISADLCREFNAVMKPFGLNDRAMFTVYGLAEACLVVSFPELAQELSTVHIMRNSLSEGQPAQVVTEAEAGSVELVRLGKAITGTELAIVDGNGSPVADNVIGRVFIKGENVTEGYYQAPLLNEDLITADGWLDTGDQGLINEGQLVLTGRTKDLIIVNGLNYYAPDLESVCESVDGIELGKVIVCGIRDAKEAVDDLVVFVLYRGELDSFYQTAIDVRRELSEKSGLDVAHVLPIKTVPKTTSGKVQRFALSNQFIDGQFNEVIAALIELSETRTTESVAAGSPVERTLLEICHDVVADQKISLNDNIFEMGTSSLKLAQIHEKIDEAYPDVVELTDFFDYPTIEALAGFIATKVEA